MAELRVGFWSADCSPWQAVVRLRRNCPALAFVLTPDYAPGGVEGQGARVVGARAPEGSGNEERVSTPVSRGRVRRG